MGVVERIAIETSDGSNVVRMHGVRKRDDGSGYSCEIEVASGGFSCRRPFSFDDTSLSLVLPAIEGMIAGRAGATVIKERFEPDFLEIRASQTGQVTVSGEIYDSGDVDQRLRFSFRTEPRVLAPLARDLRALRDR